MSDSKVSNPPPLDLKVVARQVRAIQEFLAQERMKKSGKEKADPAHG